MIDDLVYQAAWERFAAAIADAHTIGLQDPTAMALATVGPDGRPSVRMVLMRGWDERGLKFYTNFDSRKGRELSENPRAAVCFYWESLHRQIRIEGVVERTSDEDADAYWASRPRESRIAATASSQSQPLPDRQALARRVSEIEHAYPGDNVPRPSCWGGFRLIPDRFEFWHGQPARLHEREVYEQRDGHWVQGFLYP